MADAHLAKKLKFKTSALKTELAEFENDEEILAKACASLLETTTGLSAKLPSSVAESKDLSTDFSKTEKLISSPKELFSQVSDLLNVNLKALTDYKNSLEGSESDKGKDAPTVKDIDEATEKNAGLHIYTGNS